MEKTEMTAQKQNDTMASEQGREREKFSEKSEMMPDTFRQCAERNENVVIVKRFGAI